jgi:hypothetical protein
MARGRCVLQGPDIVQKMIITIDSAYITKGPATDLEGFDISTSYLKREKRRKRDQDGRGRTAGRLGLSSWDLAIICSGGGLGLHQRL